MKNRGNDTCCRCPMAHNAFNGRYCNRLKRLVEYAKEPPCVDGETIKADTWYKLVDGEVKKAEN